MDLARTALQRIPRRGGQTYFTGPSTVEGRRRTTMSTGNPKDLNRRWIEAFNTQDWEAEAACRTADYLAHLSGMPGPLDANAWAGFMQAFTAAFPDARITIEDDVSEGNTV